MTKSIALNPAVAAERKKMHTQAEYAVMSALNALRHETKADLSQHTTPTEKFVESATHAGSYFFSTDQMAEHKMGSENFTRRDRVATYDDWNIKHDIDLALCDMYTQGKMKSLIAAPNEKNCYISVKKMDKAVETGKVSIELFSFNHDRPNQRRNGWIVDGCSDYTTICIGTKFIIMKTTELKALVENNKHIFTVFDHLRSETVEINRKQNRTYDDASNIIIPIGELLKMNSSKVMDLPEWYATKWKAKQTKDVREDEVALWERFA